MRVEFRKALIVVLVVVLSYFNVAEGYYNPRVGRFSRMDPYTGQKAQPQSLHKYGYVHNNPVNRTDPTGMFALMTQPTVWSSQAQLREIDTKTSITVGERILHGIYTSFMTYQFVSSAYNLDRLTVVQEVQSFVDEKKTSTEPMTQAEFDRLEERIRRKRRGIYRKKLYLHYSFGDPETMESLLGGLAPAGVYNPEGSYATRDVYLTGWEANNKLAMPPDKRDPRNSIYFVIPRYGYGPTDSRRVVGRHGWEGRGYEYIFGSGSGGPGTVAGPIPIPVGTRP